MLTIAEELKKNTISQFHLLYGEERYMVRYYKRSLMEKLSSPGDEMNCTVFQGEAAKPEAIADVGQILPFMAPQRLILVQDSGFFKNANDMTEVLEAFPESTYVVFVEREVDKRSRLYKWMGKHGCVTECQSQSDAMLKQWIAGYLKKSDKSISTRTAEYLIERAGTDMELLSNELDKLIGYTGERRVVETADVEAIGSGMVVSRIFDMIDAVAQGERDRALRLYDDLLANRESPMSILYLFSRHINILLQFKELSGLGLNRNELAKKIGVPPFTLQKYGKQAGMFKRRELLAMLEERLNYEESFKQGRLSDQLAVEMFLIQALTNR
ncbi:MAG: DNA polymerase III subunit delta [Lachnospiraceae bacterium]|nr:DNA polymerase III subunit delta [Lachnospiraceae bacterium]